MKNENESKNSTFSDCHIYVFSKTFEYKFTYIFPLRLLIWSNTKSTTSEMEMLSVGSESLTPNKFLDPMCTIDSSEGFIGLNIFNFPSAVFLKLIKKNKNNINDN